MWLKILSVILVIAIAATAMLLFTKVEKECCLCNTFRYHAPCLIDLETGKLIELDLYFPHPTLVTELSDFQSDQGTFSFVRLGNVSGYTDTANRIIKIDVPSADKTSNPALCKDCQAQLQAGYDSRYILADLYDKEAKTLIPINADTKLTLRCYEITMNESKENKCIDVIIQGILQQKY